MVSTISENVVRFFNESSLSLSVTLAGRAHFVQYCWHSVEKMMTHIAGFEISSCHVNLCGTLSILIHSLQDLEMLKPGSRCFALTVQNLCRGW